MNETLALIISSISVAGGISGVLFFKNKNEKELLEKSNKISELEGSINKIKDFSKDEILKTVNENNRIVEENKRLSEQLNISQAEIFSLKEENEFNLSNQNENNLNVIMDTEQLDKPLSILFVDDSPVIRVTMKKILKNENYELTLVNDGLEALNILKEKHFDLIITDLEMPNLDGFGLMAQLSNNEDTKDIPVVVLTGHDDVTIKIEEANNLVGLYKKPWNEVELLKRIKLLSHLKNQANK